ncbi:predicted protein [Arabidopsis lyrata subsp. lyrata]|uniref:Predicted protein n=1 Tax=Arabidopsis lyrata subsp. lyrata TaxID=81972 RepID=D7MDY9_ARALL|nr:predicted protein [Arabidopsis lyrata subsp. lyrata]
MTYTLDTSLDGLSFRLNRLARCKTDTEDKTPYHWKSEFWERPVGFCRDVVQRILERPELFTQSHNVSLDQWLKANNEYIKEMKRTYIQNHTIKHQIYKQTRTRTNE